MSRTFASLAIASGLMIGMGQSPAAAQTAPTQPLVTVVDLVVNTVSITPAGQLVANATATLDIVGRRVTRNLLIPLDLGGSPGAEGECDILNLSISPIDLNLLGLVVELDDCEDGPVTIDITAVEGEGNLLGNLLCAIAGLLDGGLNLQQVLAGLTDPQRLLLTGAIRDVLNEVFGQLLAAGGGVTAAVHEQGHQGRCDILTLELPEGITLDVLGLVVDTSGICLDVYAVEGPGNLLGNLLCSLTDLLNNGGNTALAQRVLVRNIVTLINRLGL